MRLRFLVLFLLALPGLGLGQGWSLRFCTVQLLGAPAALGDCCTSDRAEPSCCTDEDAAPRIVRDAQEACSSCCFELDTPSEPTTAGPGPQHEHVKLAQVQDLAASVLGIAAPPLAHDARAPRSHAPPGEPGRAKPLPLRI